MSTYILLGVSIIGLVFFFLFLFNKNRQNEETVEKGLKPDEVERIEEEISSLIEDLKNANAISAIGIIDKINLQLANAKYMLEEATNQGVKRTKLFNELEICIEETNNILESYRVRLNKLDKSLSALSSLESKQEMFELKEEELDAYENILKRTLSELSEKDQFYSAWLTAEQRVGILRELREALKRENEENPMHKNEKEVVGLYYFKIDKIKQLEKSESRFAVDLLEEVKGSEYPIPGRTIRTVIEIMNGSGGGNISNAYNRRALQGELSRLVNKCNLMSSIYNVIEKESKGLVDDDMEALIKLFGFESVEELLSFKSTRSADFFASISLECEYFTVLAEDIVIDCNLKFGDILIYKLELRLDRVEKTVELEEVGNEE